MLSDIDMSAVYPEIACPVLVLAGEHDPIRPPPLVRTVADAIAGSRFATIESGHFMAIQTPALVAKAMTNFFMDAGI
jgi:pimeloyl-ACP methyl ester carboxylesterase